MLPFRIARGVVFVAILSSSAIAVAQTNTGQIKGVVRDHAGAVIPGAAVTAINIANDLRSDRLSDSSGEFLFPSLPVGEWKLTISAYGFKQLIKTGIDLRIGQVVDLRLELEIGELTVTETVTTADQFLQQGTAEVSEVIDRRRVADLPLNGRQFLQLALLSEGVVKPAAVRAAARCNRLESW
jgi:hypothetical protein